MNEEFASKPAQGYGVDLTPADWSSYIGQEKIKDLIRTKIRAANSRLEQLDHCLFVGESGAGKTSLANLVAEEHGLPFLNLMITPNFKTNTLNKYLMEFSTGNEVGGIVFLDEIHLFNKEKQHNLFSILNEHCIALDSGQKIFFPTPLTIIAATTEEQMLVKPLRGRFDCIFRLEDYSDEEMTEIVKRMAYKLGLNPSDETCRALGRASAGSPRQAKNLVKASRDIGFVDDVKSILRASDITEDGLTVDHVAYLSALKNLGMKAGLSNLVNHTNRSKEIIADIEKLLVRKNFVTLTGSGRELMPAGSMALKRAQEKD